MKEELFPAYAGVNLCEGAVSAACKTIPRVCGGESDDDSVLSKSDLYSPRMRG